MAKPKVPYSKADPNRVSYWAGKGLYRRKVGFLNGQPKGFLVGGDEAPARDRAGKLQKLWDEQQALGHEEWTPEALELAEAIRKGEQALVVEAHPNQPGQDHLTDWNEQDGYFEVRPKLNEVVIRRNELAPTFAARTKSQVIPVRVMQPSKQPQTSQGLYAALDAFAAHIRATMMTKSEKVEDSTTTQWGDNFAKSVLRTKAAIKDLDLALFGLAEIEAIIRHWKARPYRKGSGKRISIDTVADQISSLKRFLKWLHKAPVWQWRYPQDLDFEEDLWRINKKQLMTDTEISKAVAGPQTYTVDELCILWRYATQVERYYLIVALNCAFAEAEHASLRLRETDLKERKIKRIRVKSGVYGEFLLWPETVAAIQWQLAKRKGIQPGDLVLVTEKGGKVPYYALANIWGRLHRRIKKDYEEFTFLPFKHLRKTSGQMVQDVMGGEIAACHMSMGKRITDEQIDRYTRRPFEKVFEAQTTMRQMLQKMFDEGPAEPFSGNQSSKSYISLKTIRTMNDLLLQGLPKKEIAQQLGVSVQTVYRAWNKTRPTE